MPVEEPREIVCAFRLTRQEAAHLDAAGQALRQPRTRGDFARASALHAAKTRVPPPAKPIKNPARRLPALDTQLLAKILGQLGQVGTRLEEVTKIVTDSGSRPPSGTIAAMSMDVIEVRNAVRKLLSGASDMEVTP